MTDTATIQQPKTKRQRAILSLIAARPVHSQDELAALLEQQGYEKFGVLGTSLGSCLALLTTAHEPLIRVQALNHVSPYFADVVWRGLSTEHVRKGLDGHIDLSTVMGEAIRLEEVPATVDRMWQEGTGGRRRPVLVA